MLRLNCFIQVSRTERQEVLECAERLTAASLLQDGCVAYDIFESATRRDVLMICETWRDQAALDAHSASEEFVREVNRMKELAELKLEIFSF
ncbi:MAG: antibiotic biosynthesis monooxygenase [Paramuribaculum sp.]|nr:antibiotic biosynthesis monooxygenase [Paramuribaculum sp.]MDE6322953.1 antibiotic biosynthesis monooxygenase [Paramuribaculum sp.]